MIKTITNITASVLDISPVKDVNGNPVTLRPKASRDLPEASWRHDAVERVLEMKWATLTTPVGNDEAAPAGAPAPAPTVDEGPPAPPPVVETKTEEPVTPPPVVETKVEEPPAPPAEVKLEESVAVEEAPVEVKTEAPSDDKRARSNRR